MGYSKESMMVCIPRIMTVTEQREQTETEVQHYSVSVS